MAKTHISTDVRQILVWWLSGVRACLGEKLRTVMLHGSVALDDFCPRWSDVDVCVLLESPITPEEGDVVGALHDELERCFIGGGDGSWESGQAVEGSYIPVALATDPSLAMPCYTAGGTTRRWAVEHPISPFDRYILAHFGFPFVGDHVSFIPPDADDLIEQTDRELEGLRGWNENSSQSAIWMAGMLHWTARSLVFWRDDRMLSKSAALRHEIERGSEFASAFALALDIRRTGSATAADHTQELQRRFTEVARPAAREIERHLRE